MEFCIPLTLNANCTEEKSKYNPHMNTDTVLRWLQPATDLSGLRVWDLFNDVSVLV